MKLKVSEELVGTRIDQAIIDRTEGISRAYIQKLCKRGDVIINGKPAAPNYRLKDGDQIVINHDFDMYPSIPIIKIPVIYEDKDCVVIDKPCGVLSHSKGNFNPEATIATWLASRIKELSGERAGIVHRLDRATSGVMICAKTPEAMSWLQKQFSQRKVKKTYVAIINGTLEPSEAIIDMPIERNPKAPATFRVGANGKLARTHYKIIKTNGVHSMIELKPETGRTHQLRVHLKKLGRPIVGDIIYGGEVANRLYLHATSLELTLPNRSRHVFHSKLPKDFNQEVSTQL
jgi:23S rRNA pseudouridine1911/1915/1917 synthase